MMRMKWIVVLLLASLVLSACRPIQAPSDLEANKALLQQYAEGWSGGPPELFDAVLDPDFVLHHAEFPGITRKTIHNGWVASILRYAPDFTQTPMDMIAEGDWVVTLTLISVTPPERQGHADYGMMSMARIANSQIAELWMFSDEVAVGRYYGEIPNPEQRYDSLWGDDGTAQGVTETRAETVAIVREWLEGDESAAQRLVSDEFVFHSTMYPRRHAFDDRTQIMAELRTAFPDLTITVEDPLIVEGDKVGVRFTMQGTNTGPFLDREASGKVITWPGIAIYRVLDGAIVEEWILWSGYYVYSQIRGW